MKIITRGTELGGQQRRINWIAEAKDSADMDWSIALGSFPTEWKAGELRQETESGEVYQGRVKKWPPLR